MVERLRLAIQASYNHNGPDWERAARNALEAMLKPTPAMRKAYHDARDRLEGYSHGPYEPDYQYGAMIDAALTEGE